MLKSTRNFPSKKTKTAENRLIFFFIQKVLLCKTSKGYGNDNDGDQS